jgi:predicted permease
MLSGIRHELQLALRGLARRPGFSASSIATLALGIGASTAIFSVAYGISLRPLPYASPDRLIRIYEANPANGELEHDVAIGTFHAWREGAASIESAALFLRTGPRFLAGDVDSPAVTMVSVSPAFFEVLGVRPLLGEGFRAERTYTRFTAGDEAIISFAAWHRFFGGARDVIGRSLEFEGVGDNDVFRVVGVMPEGFAFGAPADLWRPTRLVELPIGSTLRLWRYDGVVARLRPEATLDRALAELKAISATLARDYPKSNAGWTASAESLHASVIGEFGRATWMLLASVAVVLLVTCLNVGGLLTARAIARQRETAVRVALGAGPWRLLRLWICEAAVLAVLGGAIGLLLAWAGVVALRASAPPGIPRVDAVRIDTAALIVTVISTLLSVLAFAAAPFRVAWRDVAGSLRSGPGQAAPARVSRAAIAMAQCAGATTLVVLALLLARSFQQLMAVDLGWTPDRVLSMTINPRIPRELRRPWYRYVQWSDELTAQLAATPGIAGAAITTQVPLSPTYAATLARGRGKSSAEVTRWPGVQHSVSDGYFQIMGMRIVAGRTFNADDRLTEAQLIADQPAEFGVAVVTDSTARALWPGQPALGQALWLPDIDRVAWREVVGVVQDIQFRAVGETPALHVFVPWTQFPSGRPRLLVKGTGSGSALAPVVQSAAQQVSPGTRIDQIASLETLLTRATAQPRFTSAVVAAFGALALLLAGVGLYGTLSFMVGARLREIGIRMALGASRERVVTAVLGRGLLSAITGGVIGTGAAVVLARVFKALLFNVTSLDPVSLTGAAVALLLVAGIAAAGPAAAAARTDPARALRAE